MEIVVATRLAKTMWMGAGNAISQEGTADVLLMRGFSIYRLERRPAWCCEMLCARLRRVGVKKAAREPNASRTDLP